MKSWNEKRFSKFKMKKLTERMFEGVDHRKTYGTLVFWRGRREWKRERPCHHVFRVDLGTL